MFTSEGKKLLLKSDIWLCHMKKNSIFQNIHRILILIFVINTITLCLSYKKVSLLVYLFFKNIILIAF